MVSGEGASRALSPTTSNDDGFPQFPRSEIAGPPSIISSRMTDIMTEDGRESEIQRGAAGQRRSGFYSDATSRPGTARTGVSSRSPWAQGASLRRGLSGKRGSVAGSVGSSSLGGRPASSTSRSHVPSLTSHAFFRPMSSQKLQAQRGITRPSSMNPHMPSQGESQAGNRDSVVSNPGARVVAQPNPEGETRPPPSRGTEFTDQDAFDHVTATTSPTHGHHATSSLADSVRPLQRKPEGVRKLTLDMNKPYKPGVNIPTPVRTPRSLRSSFLMPRGDSVPGNREIEGGEKLDSVASSPQLPPLHGKRGVQPNRTDNARLGRNWEYFQGSTVFWLGGRLQNARQRPVNIATGALVVIPAALFFGFSAPWIWDNISPAVPITFAYVFFICMSSFFHASVSDPGVSFYVATTQIRAGHANRVARSYHETFTGFLCQTKTKTPSDSVRRRRSGSSSSHLKRQLPPWKFPPSIAKHAMFGDLLAPITAACATTASRRRTTIASGSTTASAAATTAISLPSSPALRCSPSISPGRR